MTQEDIDEVNSKCKFKDLYNEFEGILNEPSGIPIDIKEPVIYMRWRKGEWYGASCYEDSYLQWEDYYEPMPDFSIIDLLLEKIAPNLKFGYNDFKLLFSLFSDEEEEGDKDYYGNGYDYYIRYITLSKFENLIQNKLLESVK